MLTTMAQCKACGARNADAATFCVRCGADVRIAEGPGESTDALSPVTDATMVLPTVAQPTEVSAAERLLEDAAALLDRQRLFRCGESGWIASRICACLYSR